MRKALLSLACLAMAAPALAGGIRCHPPLVYEPYQIGDRRLPFDPKVPDTVKILAFLDGESETLVRMEGLRRLASKGGLDSQAASAILDSLQDRYREFRDARETAYKRRWFDYCFAYETFAQLHPSLARGRHGTKICAIRDAVHGLDDAAAWLALARAASPLMSTATIQEHAGYFVKAWDLAGAMPSGEAKDRLVKTLEYDLENLEAYLLDSREDAMKVPSPTSRLGLLRKLAGRSEP